MLFFDIRHCAAGDCVSHVTDAQKLLSNESPDDVGDLPDDTGIDTCLLFRGPMIIARSSSGDESSKGGSF